MSSTLVSIIFALWGGAVLFSIVGAEDNSCVTEADQAALLQDYRHRLGRPAEPDRDIDAWIASANALSERRGGSLRLGRTSLVNLTDDEFASKYLMPSIGRRAAKALSSGRGDDPPPTAGFPIGQPVFKIPDPREVPSGADPCDYRKLMTPLKHQRGESCYAYGAAGAAEAAVALETGQVSTDLSVQQILDCYGGNAATGGALNLPDPRLSGGPVAPFMANNALATMAAYATESDTEAHPCRFNESTMEHVNLTNDYYFQSEENMRTALGGDYPCQRASALGIARAINAHGTGFQSYKSGVYDHRKLNGTCGSGVQHLNHIILVVGFGEESSVNGETVKYWWIKNSWGTDWGYDGYGKMLRDANECGIGARLSDTAAFGAQ